VVVVASLALGACGLPIDDRVQPYDDVPFDLGGPTTTVLETTTTTVPPDPQVTTTTIVRTVPVDIVYVLGGGGLQRVTLALPAPVSNRLLIDRLENPPSDGSTLLRTEVDPGLVNGFSIDRGLATVSLDRSVLQRLGSLEQRRAIAQLVLTLTLFTTDEGGIGQVRFTVEATPISVFVPARGSNSEPGEALAYADFAVLLADSPGTTAPTVTTTVAPIDGEGDGTTTSTSTAVSTIPSTTPATTVLTSTTSVAPSTTVDG
jgi:hypothetical protein